MVLGNLNMGIFQLVRQLPIIRFDERQFFSRCDELLFFAFVLVAQIATHTK
ncbi:hypothetical protein [Muribacter muris]|uniref:hypothetical protein n=1 Tax=Muribacter muris TaxID=67855 RepID=UPI0034DB0546